MYGSRGPGGGGPGRAAPAEPVRRRKLAGPAAPSRPGRPAGTTCRTTRCCGRALRQVLQPACCRGYCGLVYATPRSSRSCTAGRPKGQSPEPKSEPESDCPTPHTSFRGRARRAGPHPCGSSGTRGGSRGGGRGAAVRPRRPLSSRHRSGPHRRAGASESTCAVAPAAALRQRGRTMLLHKPQQSMAKG